jgi:hypothetical protein
MKREEEEDRHHRDKPEPPDEDGEKTEEPQQVGVAPGEAREPDGLGQRTRQGSHQ